MVNPETAGAETAFDAVGRYRQDEINGFDDALLNRFLDRMAPSGIATVLDAMGGDGNLTLRLFEYCRQRGIPFPKTTVLELSRVQCEFARMHLAGTGARVVRGNILELNDLDSGERLPDSAFDRIMVKSANHEISRERQSALYSSLYRLLAPGGVLVNLGFLFDDSRERDELRSIARVKDTLAGMNDAAVNRHFLTRDELYRHLAKAGFVDIVGVERIEYRIRSERVAEQYFLPKGLTDADYEHQAAQARARTMRRNGRIVFEGDRSLMLCPGEITVARRPTTTEANAIAFRRCPYDVFRNLRVHRELLDKAFRALPERGRVLDLGCGIGLLAERLIGRGCQYLGIDISAESIQRCQETCGKEPGFAFERGDLNEFVPAPEAFDAVAILNTLNLPGIDAHGVLLRAVAALRPGGRILVSGPTSSESFLRAAPLIQKQLQEDGLWEECAEAFRAVSEANERIMDARGNYWAAEGVVSLLRNLGCHEIVADTEVYHRFSYLVVAGRGPVMKKEIGK